LAQADGSFEQEVANEEIDGAILCAATGISVGYDGLWRG
jgi:hypothetical protein